MHIKFVSIALLVTGLLSAASCAQVNPAKRYLDPIKTVHIDQDNVGLAAVLKVQDRTVEDLYLGSANLEHSIEVSSETKFQSMSVTKAFVGAALIKTASLGLIDLDAPIQTYLPEYPASPGSPITLRMLAGHTSGLPHLRHPDRRNLYVQHFKSAMDALETFKDLDLLDEPGESYNYSSAGYTLIAAVLETVHEKSFPELLEDLILNPLDLKDTQSGNVQRPIEHLARSYSYIDIWNYEPVDVLQQVPSWDFSYNFGGGNLVTTAEDLANFGNAFTEPGFFTPSELETFYEAIDSESSSWSFGWFVNEDEHDNRYISISGATPGVQAGLIVYPERKLVISALSNTWGKGSAGGDLVVGAPFRASQSYLGHPVKD